MFKFRPCLLIVVLISLASMVSCGRFTLRRDNATPKEFLSENEYKYHSFLFGFIPGRQIREESFACPDGRIETAHFRMSSTDVLIAVATAGIYVPHRVSLACSQHKR